MLLVLEDDDGVECGVVVGGGVVNRVPCVVEGAAVLEAVVVVGVDDVVLVVVVEDGVEVDGGEEVSVVDTVEGSVVSVVVEGIAVVVLGFGTVLGEK